MVRFGFVKLLNNTGDYMYIWVNDICEVMVGVFFTFQVFFFFLQTRSLTEFSAPPLAMLVDQRAPRIYPLLSKL